jgi:hypothetical protein
MENFLSITENGPLFYMTLCLLCILLYKIISCIGRIPYRICILCRLNFCITLILAMSSIVFTFGIFYINQFYIVRIENKIMGLDEFFEATFKNYNEIIQFQSEFLLFNNHTLDILKMKPEFYMFRIVSEYLNYLAIIILMIANYFTLFILNMLIKSCS